MSVIEAAALGCFPLLSDIPAHRQLIAEGKYYFQLDNPQELVEKIKSVINGWRQGESVKGIGGGAGELLLYNTRKCSEMLQKV